MITIEVYGIPRPGGGKIAGFNRKTGKPFVRPGNPNTAPWRADVALAASKAYSGPLLENAIFMTYDFRFPRPKSHYGSGKNSHMLKKDAPVFHSKTPDLTKIIRSTEDALTGVVWKDDAQVYSRQEVKRYCEGNEKPGVTISMIETKPKDGFLASLWGNA